MDFAKLFAGFWLPVGAGTAAVFLLIGFVRLTIPSRTPVLVSRKPIR
jgi:hypothetical protein